jgi:hypothetical protein
MPEEPVSLIPNVSKGLQIDGRNQRQGRKKISGEENR